MIQNNTELHARKFSKSAQNIRNHYFGLVRQILDWCESNAIGPPHAIGVTGTKSKSGRSTIAFNMAAAVSDVLQEPTLLLKADLGSSFEDR